MSKVSRQKHGDFLPAAEPADQDRTVGRLLGDVATLRARLPRHECYCRITRHGATYIRLKATLD